MKRKISLFLCFLLAASSAAFSACAKNPETSSSGELKEVVGTLDETLAAPRVGSIAESVILLGENKDEYPMGVWSPVGNSMYISDESYAAVAEAGYNFAVGEVEFAQTHRRQSLEFAKKYGIGLFFTDGNIVGTNRPGSSEAIKSAEECAQVIATLDNSFAEGYDNFLGYVLTDEPNKNGITQIGNFMDAYNDAFADKGWLGYSNIFPSYADMLNIGYLDWEQYVKDYVEVTELPYLSIDYYPHSPGSGTVFGLIMDMHKAAVIARTADIPLWATIQTVESPQGRFKITQGIADHANYLNLAMGAKGMTSWLYAIPSHHKLTTAMVNLKNQKTYVYDLVKNSNLEIEKLANYMLTLDYQNVAYVDSTLPMYPKFAQPLKDFCAESRAIKGFGGDGYIVTSFRNSFGDEKLFVVNLSEKDSCTFALEWKTENVTSFHLWENGVQKGYKRNGDKIVMKLEAGKGVLIEPNVQG